MKKKMYTAIAVGLLLIATLCIGCTRGGGKSRQRNEGKSCIGHLGQKSRACNTKAYRTVS